MNIQEIRKKYPQYNDLSDQELAAGLHKKFYSDLPFGEFARRIGLQAEVPAAPTAPEVTPAQRVAAVETPPPVVSPEEIAPAAVDSESPVTDFLGRVARNVPRGMSSDAAGVFRSIGEFGSKAYQETPAGRFYQALTGTIGKQDPGAAFAQTMAELGQLAESEK